MLSDILGSLFIFFGAIFFLYPESLRKRLRWKATWKLRWCFLVTAVSLAILLISVGWRQEGFLPKVVLLAGIVLLFKGLLFLSSQAVEKATAWILERPVWHLRIFAVGQMALGGAILFGLTQ